MTPLDTLIAARESDVALATDALNTAKRALWEAKRARRFAEVAPVIARLSDGLHAALVDARLPLTAAGWDELAHLELARRQDATEAHPRARFVLTALGCQVRDALRAGL